MNDERSVSAVGGSQALASEPELAPVAVPARRTERTAADDPLALSHRDKRLIAISMMLPVFLGSGITENNLAEFYNEADGFIIGSAFKLDGLWSNTIDPARVASLLKAVPSLK